MDVKLEWYEYAMASEVGRMMQLSSVRQGLPDAYGYSGAGWSEHIEGACGELVVAKALNIYWAGGINIFKLPDVDNNIQVRTRSKHFYDLIVRQNDSDDDLFVHVTGTCPNYKIHGYMQGRDAKREQWLFDHGNRPPAYFVPQEELVPIEDLLVRYNVLV